MMAYLNLWGVDPITEKPRAYATHVTPGDLSEYIAQATALGWTQLTTGLWVDPLRDTSSESGTSERTARTTRIATPSRPKKTTRPKTTKRR